MKNMSTSSTNPPRSSEEAALMNARKREKKIEKENCKKPTTESGWVSLSEEMKKWYEENPNARSRTSFPRTRGYTPFKFLKWRKESKTFADALESITAICLERRDEYMHSKDKLYLQYLKQLPQYDLEYAEYEMEKSAKESDALINAAKQIPLWQGAKAMRKEEKDKK